MTAKISVLLSGNIHNYEYLRGQEKLPTQKYRLIDNAQKMKFSIKDIFIKFDQIRSFLRIWLYLLGKPLMENFIVCVVRTG